MTRGLEVLPSSPEPASSSLEVSTPVRGSQGLQAPGWGLAPFLVVLGCFSQGEVMDGRTMWKGSIMAKMAESQTKLRRLQNKFDLHLVWCLYTFSLFLRTS